MSELLFRADFDEHRDNMRNSPSVFLVVYAGSEKSAKRVSRSYASSCVGMEG